MFEPPKYFWRSVPYCKPNQEALAREVLAELPVLVVRQAPGDLPARAASQVRRSREHILAAAQDEFANLRQHLPIQIERTAQMQRQLDAIYELLRKALEAES
jgi:hypothetical protein